MRELQIVASKATSPSRAFVFQLLHNDTSTFKENISNE